MSTVTESREIELRDKRRFLLSNPQRLGILPTWWFWTEKENWHLVSGSIGVIAGLSVIIVSALGLHPAVAGLVVALVTYFCVGAVERYVRRRAARQSGGSSE